MARELSLEVRWQRLGKAVDEIGLAMQQMRTLMVEPNGMSIRAPTVEKPEFFIVLRGIDEEGAPCVAFHSAFSLDEALVGLSARLMNGTLKWREDAFR